MQFDQLLANVELEVRSTRQLHLDGGAAIAPARCATTLLYVTAGRLLATRRTACVMSGAVPGNTLEPVEVLRELPTGAALLTLGRSGVSFEAAADTVVLEMTLAFTGKGGRLERLLPDPVVMAEFSALEPGAAALAREMGPVASAPADSARSAARMGDGIICKLMAQTLVLGVLRSWLDAGCAPKQLSASLSETRFDRVLRAVHENPGGEWTLDKLAALAAMSRAMFARRFREELGQTPGQYVAEVRMADAKRLLATGESVTRTSRELGYASDEGFSRAFRRHTGVQPSRWRESQLAS